MQYEVSGLGTCIKEPTEAGMCALKRVDRYLLGTKNAAIRFEIRGRSDRAVIAGWADSDWAGDVSTRRSQSSGHIEIDGCPVSGFSPRQSVEATSSGVAEFSTLRVSTFCTAVNDTDAEIYATLVAISPATIYEMSSEIKPATRHSFDREITSSEFRPVEVSMGAPSWRLTNHTSRGPRLREQQRGPFFPLFHGLVEKDPSECTQRGSGPRAAFVALRQESPTLADPQ